MSGSSFLTCKGQAGTSATGADVAHNHERDTVSPARGPVEQRPERKYYSAKRRFAAKHEGR